MTSLSSTPMFSTPSTAAPAPDVTVRHANDLSSAQALPEADAHLVRLCLDLQLDAMLLAVGASAVRPAADGVSSDAAAQRAASTWQRWMREDLQMVCALAEDVLRGGAALPPTLGSEPQVGTPSAAVEHLTARYESMADLLAGVVDTTDAGAQVCGADTAREALARCRRRLDELTRGRPVPSAAPAPGAGAGPRTPVTGPYLPGELLG
jgi:hypothetical protein